MRLNRDWIEAHIPHTGRMCLLEEVLEFDAERIRCSSVGHRDGDHPLRSRGRLGAACGVELAAQTMAVHGALTAGESAARPRAGFLAALRGLRLYAARLDDVPSPLVCTAVLLAGDAAGALYDFELSSADRRLLRGRAIVVFDAEALGSGGSAGSVPGSSGGLA